MNKKIISLSILTATIILLTGFTPALASNKNNLTSIKSELVTIEVITILVDNQNKYVPPSQQVRQKKYDTIVLNYIKHRKEMITKPF